MDASFSASASEPSATNNLAFDRYNGKEIHNVFSTPRFRVRRVATLEASVSASCATPVEVKRVTLSAWNSMQVSIIGRKKMKRYQKKRVLWPVIQEQASSARFVSIPPRERPGKCFQAHEPGMRLCLKVCNYRIKHHAELKIRFKVNFWKASPLWTLPARPSKGNGDIFGGPWGESRSPMSEDDDACWNKPRRKRES